MNTQSAKEEIYVDRNIAGTPKQNQITEPDITVSQVYMVFSTIANGLWRHQSVEPYHRLMIITKGNLNSTVMGQTCEVKTNDIIYVPKNATYISQSRSEILDHTCILFDCIDIPGDDIGLNYFHTPGFSDKYTQLFKELQSTFWSTAFGSMLKSRMLLYDLLRNLYREQYMSDNMSKYYSGLEPAIKYINEKYTSEDLSISFLAELCGITTTHFARVFKAIYGTTPVKYINNLRIEKAVALLTHTSLSITEISEQTGFSDTSYFSKAFKKIHGVSPLNYKYNK